LLAKTCFDSFVHDPGSLAFGYGQGFLASGVLSLESCGHSCEPKFFGIHCGFLLFPASIYTCWALWAHWLIRLIWVYETHVIFWLVENRPDKLCGSSAEAGVA